MIRAGGRVYKYITATIFIVLGIDVNTGNSIAVTASNAAVNMVFSMIIPKIEDSQNSGYFQKRVPSLRQTLLMRTTGAISGEYGLR
jgi:hypothetical protein